MDCNERRRSQRVRTAAIASLTTRGGLCQNDQGVGTVRDLSRTGIGLETGQPPTRGQRVTLRLALDDEIFELETCATRVERKPDSNFYIVGLDWRECSADELAFLDRVLAVGINGRD